MRAAVRLELPRLVTVAVPLALGLLAHNAMGLVDTLMAGRLGPEALAGIALGSISFFFVTVVMSSMLYAVGAMVAQATGARRPDLAVQALRQGLLWSAGLTVPAIALLWLLPSALRLMGQDPVVVQQAEGYLRAVAYGVPSLMAFTALRAYLEGQGRTRPLMLVAFLGVGLNVVANQAFMFGRWGFPALGPHRHRRRHQPGVHGHGAGRLRLRRVARRRSRRLRAAVALAPGDRPRDPAVGWPISATVAFETGLFAISAMLMGRIGATELAGHQIAIQSASFTFMIPLALGVATTARVGHAVGRGDPLGARAAGLVGIGASVLVMTATAFTFWTWPHAVVGLYLDLADPANAGVVAHAVAFLGVAAAFQLFDGLQVSALGALRGLKDTRAPMLITLVSYWFVGLGSGVALAFGLGWGGVGLWWGLVLGLAVASLLLGARFVALLRRLQRGVRVAPPPAVDSPA
jgi:multidrug resistance protein, MATE family